MLTIFTTCRSFALPQFAIVQRNAIGSWLQLQPRPQVMVIGKSPGADEFCRAIDIEYLPDVDTSPKGVPLLNAMFKLAEKNARFDDMLFMSSDMIIFQDTYLALQIIKNHMKEYLASLIRWNADITTFIDFNDPNWKQQLLNISTKGEPSCGDYFLFSKGFFGDEMPPFVMGRGFHDFWKHRYGLQKGGLIDVTDSVRAVHQNHDHGHWHMIEKDEDFLKNKELCGGYGNLVIHTPFFLKDKNIHLREVHIE